MVVVGVRVAATKRSGRSGEVVVHPRWSCGKVSSGGHHDDARCWYRGQRGSCAGGGQAFAAPRFLGFY